jgi:DNA polymerase I-like protein with 3'-5' exonuclease and polymerase domains
MVFRGSAWGFYKDPKMRGAGLKLKEWEQVVSRYWAKYSGLDGWHKQIINHVITGDGTLQVLTGRIYKFQLYNGKYNEHQIVNYPVQGISGADILPLTAVILYKQMKKHKLKSIPILTVHDSLVFDYVKKELKQLIRIIQHTFNNMDKYLSEYYKINWNVKITGDIEIGRDYGNTSKI